MKREILQMIKKWKQRNLYEIEKTYTNGNYYELIVNKISYNKAIKEIFSKDNITTLLNLLLSTQKHLNIH